MQSRKKDSVSPKKLKLEWHPLYELCEKVITHQNKMFAIHRYSATTENTLHFVAVSAKVYFPVSIIICTCLKRYRKFIREVWIKSTLTSTPW